MFGANLLISLDTTFTCRSLWRLLFLMYRGSLTMFLRTLFWKPCIMSILLCLVQPQSWKSYVQMSFRICLYKSSLLWRDSEEFLPISQYILCYLRSIFSRFFLTWAFQLSSASNVMTRYLAVLAYGTFWLLVVTEMCSRHLLVKLIWIDLDSLNWICEAKCQNILWWPWSNFYCHVMRSGDLWEEIDAHP